MIANELLLVAREKPGVLLVGEDGEERFHVRDFAAERVGHAHRVGFVGFDERGAFLRASDDVVDEDATVEQIDLFAVRDERFAVEFEIARIGEDDGNAHAFEARFEDFEFAPGRNFAPIDDGHLRTLVGAAPIDVAGDQRVEKLGAERIAVRFECARELFEDRAARGKLRRAFRCSRRRRELRRCIRRTSSESGSRKASSRDEVLARP